MLALLLAGTLRVAGQDRPSEAEQQHMIEAMRNYAADYTDKLPDFICQEVVAQYEAGRKPGKWHQGDTLTSKLVYNKGKEQRTLVAVNGSAVSSYGRSWRKTLTTEGEFGDWLTSIFNPDSQTKFSWAGWEQAGQAKLAKFDYVVTQEHSTRELSRSDIAKAFVGYHGSVWGDPQSGEVRRVMAELDDIPKNLKTRSSVLSVDYGAVPIGGKTYLLPVRAEVVMATDTNHIRNEMQFEAYRKFEAESTITFGDPATTPNQ